MLYVALLRGVNVGGVTVKMTDLKRLLEKAGFTDVQTLLASGNVVFSSPKKDGRRHAAEIEKMLEAKYKRTIRVIVRPMRDIEMLAKSDPFKGILVTKDTRLYVTFLDKPTKRHLKTSSEFFRVVKTCPFAVCSVLTLSSDKGTVDLMGSLEKHYGKDITTRNWNTIEKILKAA